MPSFCRFAGRAEAAPTAVSGPWLGQSVADNPHSRNTILKWTRPQRPGLGAPAGSPGEAADAPKDDDAKETPATVARLCRQRAVDNGTDFDTEYAAWLRGRKEVA